MILYDSNYKFVGISDAYVKSLNFPSFHAMKFRIGGDFANLFLEKKGFIHNFEYISWIDYIQQESNAKAIIKSGDNTYYKATFEVEHYHFLENSSSGYAIHIKEMSEYELNSSDVDGYNGDGYIVSEDDDFGGGSATYTFTSLDEPEESREFSFEDSRETSKKEISAQKVEISKKEIPAPKVEEKLESSEEFKLPPIDGFQFEESEEVEEKEEFPEESSTLSEFQLPELDSGDEVSKSSENYPLQQHEIDKIIESRNFDDFEREPQITCIETFTSEDYDLERASQEIGIDKETLIDSAIDFIHHILHQKKFIFDSLENGKIKSVKQAIFMVRGLCLNLRISDIYELVEKIYQKNYSGTPELLKDINLLYSKVTTFSNKIDSSGREIVIREGDVRDTISMLNSSGLPNIIFQDIVNSFLKLYDSSKSKIENSFNPDSIESIKPTIQELANIANSLDIIDLTTPLNRIEENLQKEKIEFDKLVIDWITLSGVVDKLK
jgi:hypothetical protein